MKLNELSNPTTISDKFELIYERSTLRKYRNMDTGAILACGVYGPIYTEYIFIYNRRIDMQNHADKSLSLAIFKTVLFDMKKYIFDAGIKLFYFSAEGSDQSRIKLYDTFAKLFHKLGYNRLNIDDCSDYISGDYLTDAMCFFRRIKSDGDRAYVFAKRPKEKILSEVKNPSKPSDKFKLVQTSDLGYKKSYTYHSTYNNGNHTNDILIITFLSFGPGTILISFDLNDIVGQNPQYAHLAMAVFQTVLYQVTQYVNEYKPKVLKFSAASTELSRISLYKRICKNITGYTVEESRGNFILTREE